MKKNGSNSITEYARNTIEIELKRNTFEMLRNSSSLMVFSIHRHGEFLSEMERKIANNSFRRLAYRLITA